MKASRENDFVYQAVYRYLTLLIEEAGSSSAVRLPSLRQLADRLNVSISTVQYAYSLLEKEGRVYSIAKSGYYAQPLHVMDSPDSGSDLLETVYVNARRPGMCVLSGDEPASLQPLDSPLLMLERELLREAAADSLPAGTRSLLCPGSVTDAADVSTYSHMFSVWETLHTIKAGMEASGYTGPADRQKFVEAMEAMTDLPYGIERPQGAKMFNGKTHQVFGTHHDLRRQVLHGKATARPEFGGRRTRQHGGTLMDCDGLRHAHARPRRLRRVRSDAARRRGRRVQDGAQPAREGSRAEPEFPRPQPQPRLTPP